MVTKHSVVTDMCVHVVSFDIIILYFSQLCVHNALCY